MKAYNYALSKAENGSSNYQYHLARLFLEGEIEEIEGSVEKDPKEGFYWMSQAANLAHERAMVNLGIMLIKGVGTSIDTEKGLSYIKQAAENEMPEAQAFLGSCYMQGGIVPIDLIEAIYWLTRASENELPAAQYNLGMLYLQGEGYVKDSKQAYVWLYAALQNGISKSEYAQEAIDALEDTLTKSEVDSLRYKASSWY